MRQHKENHFVHGIRMLLRNGRSYGLLSVTIVMSFGILLGYLCFVDSHLYNKYKALFRAERNVVGFSTYAYPDGSRNRKLELDAKADDPNCELYRYYSQVLRLEQYCFDSRTEENNVLVEAEVYFMPRGETRMYGITASYLDQDLDVGAAMPFETVLGQNFGLTGNQAVINASFFAAIHPEGSLPFEMQLPVLEKMTAVQVVGVCPDSGNDTVAVDGKNNTKMYSTVYVSQELLGECTFQDLPSPRIITWCRTDEPIALAERASREEMVVCSAARRQDEAIVEIRTQKGTKGVIAIVLLLLLGINLYSSFTNALRERRFEIGVKRALGASRGHIMVQFLTESTAVMLANILLSVILVVDALVLYKLYQYWAEGAVWVVDVAPYSVAMFLVCSISLTVVFSLLFSWKSTQVEIVQYLKAE